MTDILLPYDRESFYERYAQPAPTLYEEWLDDLEVWDRLCEQGSINTPMAPPPDYRRR